MQHAYYLYVGKFGLCHLICDHPWIHVFWSVFLSFSSFALFLYDRLLLAYLTIWDATLMATYIYSVATLLHLSLSRLLSLWSLYSKWTIPQMFTLPRSVSADESNPDISSRSFWFNPQWAHPWIFVQNVPTDEANPVGHEIPCLPCYSYAV